MKPVYHIAERVRWEGQGDSEAYRHPSLETEGFIHCSTEEQLAGTMAKFFAGRSGFVLLEIDTARLVAELRYEEVEPGHLYPHLYGPLNKSAVVSVAALGASGEREPLTAEDSAERPNTRPR